MAVIYLVQHAEKQQEPGDPGLAERGREQAARTARWLSAAGSGALYSSPLRRTRQTADVLDGLKVIQIAGTTHLA